jgi:hypothetical protein
MELAERILYGRLDQPRKHEVKPGDVTLISSVRPQAQGETLESICDAPELVGPEMGKE